MGAPTSVTITLNVVGAAVLPAASVAVQVTVVVPTANAVPERGVHDTVTALSTSSEAVGRMYITVTSEPDVACALTSS